MINRLELKASQIMKLNMVIAIKEIYLPKDEIIFQDEKESG